MKLLPLLLLLLFLRSSICVDDDVPDCWMEVLEADNLDKAKYLSDELFWAQMVHNGVWLQDELLPVMSRKFFFLFHWGRIQASSGTNFASLIGLYVALASSFTHTHTHTPFSQRVMRLVSKEENTCLMLLEL
jgi:hypothetical protein